MSQVQGNREVPQYGYKQVWLVFDNSIEYFKKWLTSHPLKIYNGAPINEQGLYLRGLSEVSVTAELSGLRWWSTTGRRETEAGSVEVGSLISYQATQISPTSLEIHCQLWSLEVEEYFDKLMEEIRIIFKAKIKTDTSDTWIEYMNHSTTTINTNGGAYISGDVSSKGDFIGRDRKQESPESLLMKKDLLVKVQQRIQKERHNFERLSSNVPKAYNSKDHRRAVEVYSWELLQDDIEHLHMSKMTPDAELTSRLLNAIEHRDARKVFKLCEALDKIINIALKQVPF